MNQKELDKQRRCSYLLVPPAGEVVRALIDEIVRLQKKDELTDPSGQLSCHWREVEETIRRDWCTCHGRFCCYGDCREPMEGGTDE